ncbi:MAG: hypothetical protein KJ052_12785 [Candidatus Hydrogenedentes bacterium]|nr:hypothetical protein [Candidatus Hydrogenedentota bacterium]
MKRPIAALMLCVLLPACNLELKKDAPPASPSDIATPTSPAPMRTGLDIGDLEVTAVMHLVLSGTSTTKTVQADTLLTATDVVTMQTVSISKPYPESLMIDLQKKITSDFSVQPGIIRGEIMRQVDDKPEKEKIEDVLIVLGKKSGLEHVLAFDAFKGLDQYPETMLITLEGEGVLLDEGEDIEAVDPMTVTAPPERMTRALSVNPLRINFVDGSAPRFENAPADEEITEEAVPGEPSATDITETSSTDAPDAPALDAAPEEEMPVDDATPPAGE